MSLTSIFAHHFLIDLIVIAALIGGIRQFRAPRSARRGNLTAALALGCAFILVLYRYGIVDPGMVVAALSIGAVAGYAVARGVSMLQIPAMVAFQHGMGGIAAFLVSFVELTRGVHALGLANEISGMMGMTLGSLTFSGSMVAAAKLSSKMRQTPQLLPGHGMLVSLNMFAMVVVGMVALAAMPELRLYLFIIQIFIAAIFGVLFSIRIGGADMPVLISFLNATAGLAAAFCGIVIENQLLIAFGATVAASGSILTHVMCKAMNRSLWRVFVPRAIKPPAVKAFPAAGEQKSLASGESPAEDIQAHPEDAYGRAIKMIQNAAKIIIVPGYGMALARAQAQVVSFAQLLISKGKEVRYAIHPVAGRMPGHMNVVLAEAGVDYDMLVEMDEINPAFKSTDLVLVVGACDVVNPAAINKEGTPISGMPILLTHEAKNVVCCNLDEKPGYSGVENPLYKNANTVMLPGDARQTVQQLIDYLDLADNRPPEPAAAKADAQDPITAAAKVLLAAKKVVIIPGYGMALSQAQHKVVVLAAMLERQGAVVKFAIHPVAGRMPGHMNVVLAEAEVDYEALVEMEAINPEFVQTDAVLIVGACDVVNPAAIGTEGTPISGMPILMAHEAASVIICNYDTKPGYSGVDNPLYENSKTILLLGDAKKTAADLIVALESFGE